MTALVPLNRPTVLVFAVCERAHDEAGVQSAFDALVTKHSSGGNPKGNPLLTYAIDCDNSKGGTPVSEPVPPPPFSLMRLNRFAVFPACQILTWGTNHNNKNCRPVLDIVSQSKPDRIVRVRLPCFDTPAGCTRAAEEAIDAAGQRVISDPKPLLADLLQEFGPAGLGTCQGIGCDWDQYESQSCGPNLDTDLECQDLTPYCNKRNEYENISHTRTRDRECEHVRFCDESEFEYSPPTVVSVHQCAPDGCVSSPTGVSFGAIHSSLLREMSQVLRFAYKNPYAVL